MGKRRQPSVGTGLELHDTGRRVEIQGNLTFSPGKTAGQIEAGGASIVHKVHARQMVSEGVSVVSPKSKTKVWWIGRRGQSHMRDKPAIKDRAH